MRFGVREICDVVFKAKSQMTLGRTKFPAGAPVLYIDTATTSNMEVATTTSYANGGRGNTRLLAWEGEKTLTFTVTDALMSPIGLSILSGAGLIDEGRDNNFHMHMTTDVILAKSSDNKNLTATLKYSDFDENLAPWWDGNDAQPVIMFCDDTGVQTYGTVLDQSGAGIAFLGKGTITSNKASSDDATETAAQKVAAELSSHHDGSVYAITKDGDGVIITFSDVAENAVEAYAGKGVRLDYYVLVNSNMKTVEIDAESLGGSFYVEASTLFRREDTGVDMPAELIFPNVKIQSGFTFTMASTGDPSTFDFVMDAFPGYTMFDRSKKVLCAIQIYGKDGSVSATSDEAFHSSSANHVADEANAGKIDSATGTIKTDSAADSTETP